MCETQELLDELKKQTLRAPDFDTILLSDSRDWKLDYRGYRYVYFWLPTSAYTLSFDDYGSGLIQPQIWTNLGFRPGTAIKTVGQSTPVAIHLMFSDWLVSQ